MSTTAVANRDSLDAISDLQNVLKGGIELGIIVVETIATIMELLTDLPLHNLRLKLSVQYKIVCVKRLASQRAVQVTLVQPVHDAFSLKAVAGFAMSEGVCHDTHADGADKLLRRGVDAVAAGIHGARAGVHSGDKLRKVMKEILGFVFLDCCPENYD